MVFVFAGIAYAVVVLSWFPKWTVDDAFIIYRYAENLALHGQLTWNVGLDPVEGYTGIALPLALAAAFRAGIDPDTAAKTIGVVSFLGLAALSWKVCSRLGVPAVGRALASLAILTAPFAFTHALGGLETSAFSLFIVLSVDRAIAIEVSPAFRLRLWLGFSFATLAVALTRPEGLALSVPLACSCLLSEARRSRVETSDSERRERTGIPIPSAVSAAGIWVGVCAVPIVAWCLWRIWYYGQLLPNTFHAKLASGFVRESFVDLAKFGTLYLTVPIGVAVVALAAAPACRRMALSALPHGTTAAVAIFVAACLFVYVRSALIMNFGFRFFVPFHALVVIGAAAVATRALGGARTNRSRSLAVAGIALLAVAQTAEHVVMLGRAARDAAATERLLHDEHRRAGEFLRVNVPPDEFIVVVVDAGVIPYVSGLRTIDFGGLNDEFLSRRFRNRTRAQSIKDYFYARHPAALVFTSRSASAIDGPEPVRVEDDPRFAEYEHVRTFSSPAWPQYHLLVFLRRDIADGGDDAQQAPVE